MKNLLSYCGLVDARKSASEKDLPVHTEVFVAIFGFYDFANNMPLRSR